MPTSYSTFPGFSKLFVGCVGTCLVAIIAFLPISVFGEVIKSPDSNLPVERPFDEGVITLGGNNETFVIKSGEKIRVSAGQSVKLLPGTRIEAGSEASISIVRKDVQEIIVEKQEKRERSKTIESILRRKENDVQKPVDADVVLRHSQAKRTQTFIGEWQTFAAILPVRVQVSTPFQPCTSISIKKILPVNNFHFSNLNPWGYYPISSWGEQGETVMVFRT